VFIVVVVVVIVATANVVINVINVVDFQWCPSNFHIYPHPFVDTPHPLKKNFVSCYLLTFYLYSFCCRFCGDDIYGTSALCLPTYTNVGTANGGTLPLIIF
jgi:hypothetical protein